MSDILDSEYISLGALPHGRISLRSHKRARARAKEREKKLTQNMNGIEQHRAN